jgi:NAD(P)H dehydrogenase (quinone)
LSEEILTKMHAPAKPDYPIITANKMTEYDGFMFGLSGRFGSVPAQMKYFMDSCGGLWQSGALIGKTAATFVSVGTQGGGQEMVNLSALPFIAHQGMVYVSLGYRDSKAFSYDETHGASPWGAGTFAGADGSRQPSDLEKGIAETQGKTFAEITAKLCGKGEEGQVFA